MTKPIPHRTAILAGLVASLALSGCMALPQSAVQALPQDASANTVQLAEMKDAMAGAEPTVTPQLRPAPLVGRGFAQVSKQPGESLNQRRILAMRAARLDALRDLTEQVHGIRITSDSLLRDAVLRNDTLAARVEGTLRGARTVAITPRSHDGYAVTMQLDADTVAYILRAVGTGG